MHVQMLGSLAGVAKLYACMACGTSGNAQVKVSHGYMVTSTHTR